MFSRMISIGSGAFVSLLPERYRRWWQTESSVDFRTGAIVSAVVQTVGLIGLLIYRYLVFFQHRVMDIGERTMQAGAEEALAGKQTQFAIGALTTLEFVFQPLTLVMLYFLFEGAVRLIAPLVTEEIIGTLPLVLVARAHDKIAGVRAEAALGPRVADTVERGDGRQFDLRISSCRPKPNWDKLMTIAYQDEYYEVVKQETLLPPRRFVYLLRKNPPGKVIRGLHHYDPREALEKK
jgi:hypothetical protein